MGDEAEDLGVFWYSCTVAQRTVYKHSPTKVLGKYLSVFHTPVSRGSLSPTPSNSPVLSGSSVQGLFRQSHGQRGNQSRMCRNSRGTGMCEHTQRMHTNISLFEDNFRALETTDTHF